MTDRTFLSGLVSMRRAVIARFVSAKLRLWARQELNRRNLHCGVMILTLCVLYISFSAFSRERSHPTAADNLKIAQRWSVKFDHTK